MYTNTEGTSLIIEIDDASTFGNSAVQFMSQIKLNDDVLFVQSCQNKPIPTDYNVTNLPLATPYIYFQSATGTLGTVGYCQRDF